MSRCQNLDVGGWVTWVTWCFAKKLCTRCDRWMDVLSWWSCQLSVAAPFWIILIVSAKECSTLTQNLMQILGSTYWIILNVMATWYTSSLNRVCRPHWLVPWSHHCSHMCIPAHPLWLPGYTDVVQIILIILTVVGLFLTRPQLFTYMNTYIYMKFFIKENII